MSKEEIVCQLDYLLEEVVEHLWNSRPVVQDDDELREDVTTQTWSKVHVLLATAITLLDAETADQDYLVEEVINEDDR